MTGVMYENLTKDEADQYAFELEVEGRFDFEILQQPNGSWAVRYWPKAEGAISSERSSAKAGEPVVGAQAMAIDTLARTLWGEAPGEPRLGKEAVAAVVLNRVKRGRPDRFGATVEEVCRKPKQFSCWNPGDPNRALLEHVDRTDAAFAECLEVAQRAVEGTLPDPTDGSDHYHRDDVFPDWSRGKVAARTIGRHRFFNDIA